MLPFDIIEVFGLRINFRHIYLNLSCSPVLDGSSHVNHRRKRKGKLSTEKATEGIASFHPRLASMLTKRVEKRNSAKKMQMPFSQQENKTHPGSK